MKLMRADRLDAIVAAAVYSAMFTFGAMYAMLSNANEYRDRQTVEVVGQVESLYMQCMRDKPHLR